MRNLRAYIRVIEDKESATNRQLGFENPGKGIIMNVVRTLNNWRKFRQTVSELGRMSPRELEDLGIERHNIRRFARTANGL